MSNKPLAKVLKRTNNLFGVAREGGDLLYESDFGDTKPNVINALVNTNRIELFSKGADSDEAMLTRIQILEAKVEDLLNGGGVKTPAPKKLGRPPKKKD